MFSFFKKKPPPGASAPTPAAPFATDSGTANAAGSAAAAPSDGDRQHSPLGWLNADVGELFFGKKQTEDARASGLASAPPASPSPSTPQWSAPMSPPPVEEGFAERAGWLAKLKTGLQRTGSTIASAFVGAEIGDELYEDLEVALLQADAGADATLYLLEQLQVRVTRTHVRDAAAARRLLATIVEELLQPLERPLVVGERTPTVIMVVGVNGAGKTTSIGKLARHLLDSQRSVLLAAADTFRAAAREQLLAWAERAGTGGAVSHGAGRIEIVSQAGGDPAGVTFDAVVAGKSRGCDVVIVDTAGRLATQAHLMEELKKMKRVIAKAEPGAPHEVLLVIDGNTGQNALAQVQAFDEALQLTGLVITKLDGTAKGGVLAAIALWSRSRAQPLPVYFVGVGEKLADLQTFRAREFAAALVG
jgi:fused signal recognition particle receptor